MPTLARLVGERAAPALDAVIALLARDPVTDVRRAAANTLYHPPFAAMDSAACVRSRAALLAAAADDADPLVRATAVNSAMAANRPDLEAARVALAARLAAEPDARVRRVIAEQTDANRSSSGWPFHTLSPDRGRPAPADASDF